MADHIFQFIISDGTWVHFSGSSQFTPTQFGIYEVAYYTESNDTGFTFVTITLNNATQGKTSSYLNNTVSGYWRIHSKTCYVEITDLSQFLELRLFSVNLTSTSGTTSICIERIA